MLIRHVKIEIPTVNCHSDLLCQTTNRSFKIQGSSVAIQSRSSHLKILFHFIALPDAFLHDNLTQAPKNYFHTFWRVAPKIISILFGGGRNLKKQKTHWTNQIKNKHMEKTLKTKNNNISRLFAKRGSRQESLIFFVLPMFFWFSIFLCVFFCFLGWKLDLLFSKGGRPYLME